MGRAPCCDKANVKKGPWSPEEDAKLKSYIEQHGTGGNWIALPQKIGLKRCGKSCRLRWLNYLRPNIKHGGFSEEEDNIICSLYINIGSRWSIIAAQLPGRTDNDIKNYWNTRLKKKLLGKQRKEQQARRGTGGSLKQEIRRSGNGIPLVSTADNHSINNQNPYWPELPVLAPIPYSNQEPRLNNQDSIRKLLIKLGGKFSNDDNDNNNQHIHNSTSSPQFPSDMSNSQQLFDDQCINFSSSDSLEALNYTQFPQAQYNSGGETCGSQFLQGQSSFSAGLEDMVYGSNSQKFDGLEFLLGEDMVINNSAKGSTTCESAIRCLDEISSLVYPPLIEPNCEGFQQSLLNGCPFDNELVYP